MVASGDMKIVIATGKHIRVAISRSPLVRPSTRSPHVDGGTPITLQRSLDGLPTVAGTSRRRASSRGRCTVHHALLTIERSLISRTGARRSPEGCSSIEIGGPKHELKRITYFDLLESFTFPFGAQGGRPRRQRCPTRHNHDLPKPIRRRRPPFLLRVDARARAVRSNAFAGR